MCRISTSAPAKRSLEDERKDDASRDLQGPLPSGNRRFGPVERRHPQALRQGPRGGKSTESVLLEDEGNLLVIRTKFEGSGKMAAREFKRAYARVTQ